MLTSATIKAEVLPTSFVIQAEMMSLGHHPWVRPDLWSTAWMTSAPLAFHFGCTLMRSVYLTQYGTSALSEKHLRLLNDYCTESLVSMSRLLQCLSQTPWYGIEP